MKSRRPPRLASFLLNRITPNESLVGDVNEEFARRRSAVWYWRQVLSGLWASPRGFDIHELFSAQGVFMQLVMLALVGVCVVFTMKMVLVVIFEGRLTPLLLVSSVEELLRLAASFGVALSVGALIARIHPRHRLAAVFFFSTSVTLWAVVNLYVFDGAGNFDSVLTHVVAMLVFISGLLTGGVHGCQVRLSR